jgi:hypothetical protein
MYTMVPWKKKKSSKDIVADHQYFSWMHISSLLLQLIESYGKSDSPVHQYCFAGNPTWNSSLLTNSKINIILYRCCGNCKCDVALFFFCTPPIMIRIRGSNNDKLENSACPWTDWSISQNLFSSPLEFYKQCNGYATDAIWVRSNL